MVQARSVVLASSVVLNPGHTLESPMKVKNKTSGSTTEQLIQSLGGGVSRTPNGWVKNLWLVDGVPTKKGEGQSLSTLTWLLTWCWSGEPLPRCPVHYLQNEGLPQKASRPASWPWPVCVFPWPMEYVSGLDHSPVVLGQYLMVSAWSATGSQLCPPSS